MIPVTQTRMGRPLGNCTEACIASLLECPIAEVPDLYDPEDPERFTRFPALCEWLLARGVMWIRCVAPPADAFEMMRYHFPAFEPGHHMIGGINSGGIGHMVVGRNGAIVWDPNPSGAGLAEIEDVTFLVPLDDVPERWRGLAPSLEIKMAAES